MNIRTTTDKCNLHNSSLLSAFMTLSFLPRYNNLHLFLLKYSHVLINNCFQDTNHLKGISLNCVPCIISSSYYQFLISL